MFEISKKRTNVWFHWVFEPILKGLAGSNLENVFILAPSVWNTQQKIGILNETCMGNFLDDIKGRGKWRRYYIWIEISYLISSLCLNGYWHRLCGCRHWVGFGNKDGIPFILVALGNYQIIQNWKLSKWICWAARIFSNWLCLWRREDRASRV